MFAHSFPSLFVKFSFLALIWGPACSASEDPAQEDAGIGSASGRGGSGGKSGGGKGNRGGTGSSNAEAGAPSEGEGGAAGAALEPPASSGSGGGAGEEAEPEPEPGRGGSSGGSESGTAGSTSPAAGDSGMSRGGDGGEEPEPGTAGRAGTAGTAGRPGEEPDSEAVLRGKALAEENVCVACHQDNYAGLGFYPNLTPDLETGLGDWSDVDIANAIQNGYDRNGESLCSLMTIYPFTNEETSDIVAFLRQLPAVSNPITAVCPGHGQ